MWFCKGFNKKEDGGAFNRWHITSTDINEESFPKLKTVFGRGFEYAVAFHGFDDDGDEKSICIGGKTVDGNLKKEIKEQIELQSVAFRSMCTWMVAAQIRKTVITRITL